MLYTFHAKDKDNQDLRSEMEAKDKQELLKLALQKGYTLISFEEKKERLGFFSALLSIGGVSISDKMFFARNIGVMIDSGLSLVRSLEILSRQTKNRNFKKIITRLIEIIQKGTPLSEAMKNYPKVFSSLFSAMVKAGEESGKLGASLKIVADQLEKERNLTKKVRGALIYPVIIIVAMIAIGILMLIYVVPTLISTFNDLKIDLPASTKAIIFLSQALVNHPFLNLGALLIFIIIVSWFLRSERGRRIFGLVFLRLPLVSSLVKKINAGRTSRTLSSLIGSGVNILEALSITKEIIQNYRYKEVLENAKLEIQKGKPLSETFKKASDLYPLLFGEMLSVGEETGKISEMLAHTADFYEEEVTETTKDLTTVIEPFLMIIVGVAVGFFAISMITPMYSMMGGI